MLRVTLSALKQAQDVKAWALVPARAERSMFFWFLVAVAAVVGLTILGAFMARRSGHFDDDGPMYGGDH